VANDITEGTGNVFADLGLPDAAERQTKTRLAMAVNALLKERRRRMSKSSSARAARPLGTRLCLR